jgi:ethanolamine utilization protein EutQ (cupin superfamily)
MEKDMAGVEVRQFSSPDEVRRPERTTVELVTLGAATVGRYTFESGWRWSECIKPVVGTDTCQVEHVGYILSGTLHVEHDDGTAMDVASGDVYRIAPGHDAWVVGDDAAVVVEFQGAATYAAP